MSIIRIKIRKKSRTQSLALNEGYEHLSPEKRRKIDELLSARRERGPIEEVPRKLEPEAHEMEMPPAETLPTPTPEPVAESSPIQVPEPVPELTPVPEPEPVPEPTPVPEPELKPEPVSEPTPELVSEPIPIPRPVPEPEPVPKSDMPPKEELPIRRDSLFDRYAPLKKDVSHKKRDRTFRKIIEWGIIGLLIFSPLPAASVHKWSILLIQMTVFALFGIYLLMHERPKINPYLLASLKWPRYLFLALFVLIFVQLLPLPGFLVKIFSPNAHAFRALFSPDFANLKFMGLSLIPSHTFQASLQLVSYFLLGFLVIKTITRQHQMMRILYVLIGMSVFQALYGFFELYSSNPRILFYEKKHFLDAVTGTFINRNHLSGYLEMIIPLAIGVVLARSDFFGLSGTTWREKIVQFWGKGLYVRILIPVSIVLMSLAIIFSKSRSGIFLLILTFLLLTQFSVLHFRKFGKRKKITSRFLRITFAIVTLVALYIGIDDVIKRFSMERFLSEYRSFYWAQTAEIIGDFPLFGSGLGTFSSVYPAYDKSMIPAQFSHAHNDYLEYFSELGFFGFIFLFGGILILLLKSFFVWRERTHPRIKALTLGGVLSITLLLLHSITDFNLHIPANMLLFSVLLSLTAAMAFHKLGEDDSRGVVEEEDEIRVHPIDTEGKYATQEQKEWQKFMREKEKPVSKKTVFLILVLIGFFALATIAIFWNHYLYSAGKNKESYTKRIKILKRANAVYPKNDLAHYEMGLVNQALGLKDSKFSEVRIARLQDSSDNFERSLRINPLSAHSHYSFGKTLQSLNESTSGERKAGEGEQKAIQEYKRAVMLAAHNKQIYLDVGKTFFSRWDKLSEEDREFTKDFLNKISNRIQSKDLIGLMREWADNVKDYSIMDSILPYNMIAYTMYVELLAEKSLSSEVRQRYQTKMDILNFELAGRYFKAGENALMYRKIEEASENFGRSRWVLGTIKFYQNLIGEKNIDLDDYTNLKKSSYLQLAKCRLRLGQTFKEVEPYLQKYVQMEEREAALHDLEIFLRNRGILGASIETNLDALDRIAFQMQLYFKQGRYKDIIGVGRNLEMDYQVLAEPKRKIYAQLLHMVGDAFKKQDFLYDAATYYKKALEIDPMNLEMLFSIRDSYERYNDEEMIRQLDEMIASALSPPERLFDNLAVEKGKTFFYIMGLDGKRVSLKLSVRGSNEAVKPLVSVLFNDNVVWEKYAENGELSILVKPLAGQNRLAISPVNTDIVIQSIAYQ